MGKIIIDESSLKKREKALLIYIIFITLGIILFEFSSIFWGKNYHVTYLHSIILFIKFFNSILSILAFVSCIVLYIRLKKDRLFL